MALAGAAMGETLLTMDFTKLSGYSQDCTIDGVEYKSVLPDGWSTGQWNGNNTPHYHFGAHNNVNGGATAYHPWKQNFLYTSIDLSSQADATITFTLYNSVEDTGNMFYLSSDSYSIVIGNSYNSNSEIHVGTWNDDITTGNTFVNFQKDNVPTISSQSKDFNVAGDITYTLTMKEGNMTISAKCTSGSTWSTTLSGMQDVTFSTLGFINDGSGFTSGVKNITVSTIPEPTTATLSLLALAGLAARRRRK